MTKLVIARLDPVIHGVASRWMPVSSTGMTMGAVVMAESQVIAH